MTITVPSRARALGLVTLSCVLCALEVQAQPAKTASAAVDTFVVVVPRRPIAEVNKGIATIKEVRSNAQQRLERVKEEVRTLESLIATREKNLEAMEGRLDTLDSEKDANEIQSLQQKITLLEKFKDLLELRKEVREGEVRSVQATIAFAEAQETFLTEEAEFTKKCTERDAFAKKPSSIADLAAADIILKKLEGELLQKWEKALDLHEESVSADQDLLGLSKRLGEAQAAFHAP
jgi:chromosome segregation ATPase